MQTSSHTFDVWVLICAVAAALWAHLLADPLGSIAVIIAIMGGAVRLAINIREWIRGRA